MLRGYLDRATRHHISGWAVDEDRPDVPLYVVISNNGELLIRVLANRNREDLERVLGSGRHGFDIYLPGLCALRRHVISARIEGADADLQDSPMIIEPSLGFDAEAEASIKRQIAAADLPALNHIAGFFAEQIENILNYRAGLQSHEVLRHFRWRWFKHRGAPVANRAPDVPRRALIIDSRQPEYSGAVDGESAASLAQSLHRLGYEVTFVPVDLHPPESALAGLLGQAGVQFHYLPYTASVEEVLRRQQGTFDVVIVHRLTNAIRYIPIVRHYCSNARIIFSRPATFELFDDQTGRIGLRREFAEAVERHRVAELFAISQVDDVFTPSEADADALRLAMPEARVYVVPWTVALRPTVIPFERRHGVAFLGFEAPLRHQGTRSMIETVMKEVWAVHPEIHCIVRDESDLDLRGVLDNRVVTVGPDVTPSDLFDRVRLTVVPAVGHLAQRNVAESLGSGVPCVAPLQVLHDMGLPIEASFADMDTLPALAKPVIILHEDAQRNRQAAELGLDFIDLRHSERSVDAIVHDILKTRQYSAKKLG